MCRFAWLDLEYKEELKPCPFCGGNAILYAAGIPYVRCDNCGTQTTAYQTPDHAITAWNRRVK
jgi:Lar family restriction alleviation protein